MPAPANNTKPYIKLAGTLASLGIAIFFLEKMGLAELQKMSGMKFDGNLLSILALTPMLLILAAIIVFAVGKIRRL